MKKYFKQVNFVFFSILAVGVAFFIRENHKDISQATKIDKAYADAPAPVTYESYGDGRDGGDGV